MNSYTNPIWKALLFFCLFSLSYSQIKWTEQKTPVTHTLWAVHFVDTLHGWAAGDRGIVIRTTDGGTTWTQVPFPNGGDSLRSIIFLNPQRGWTGGAKGIIYQSVDSGKSWQSVYSSTMRYIADGFVTGDSVVYMVGNDGFDGAVLQSMNGDSNWMKTTIAGGSFLSSICFVTDSMGWVAGRDKIASTRNAGKSWSAAVTIPHNSYRSYVNKIWFRDLSNGVGSGRYGGLSHTRDGGGSWTLFDTTSGEWVEDIHFADPRRGIMVGERGEVRVSLDSGRSWKITYPRHPSSLWAPWFRSVHFPDSLHGWMAGDSGIVMKGSFLPEVVGIPKKVHPAISQIVLNVKGGFLRIHSPENSISIEKIEMFDIQGERLSQFHFNESESSRSRMVPLHFSQNLILVSVFLSNGKRHIRPLLSIH